jgi:hypothetical protein
MLDGSEVRAAPAVGGSVGDEVPCEQPAGDHGPEIIERLRRGDLPQMVDWFDPGLLAKVGVRSIISATLGAYTDQRLTQAATDNVKESELKGRYDYSSTGNPRHAIVPDETGSVWVDYIADLGDGFESTYAMAYLLAGDQLKVAGDANPLPAGKLLVMGGDQVYPDATKQEYHTRLRDPYDWAFSPAKKPMRKLFAIPGNHDWYDGLCAFSALFCSARDRISRGKGTQIGGWRCYQHRSYFAIKLEHGWWIWGPDIQLADNLDDSQRDYFDLMAEQTRPGDKIILCLAEPSWLHQNYDNMHEISILARRKGAVIVAVIAGDWHHYSRYTCDDLGIQFITCGGGGAFAHATHGLKKSIKLSWATRTGQPRTSSASDPEEFNRIERTVIAPGGSDFTLNPDAASASMATQAAPAEPAAGGEHSPPPEPKPMADSDAGPAGFRRKVKRMRQEDIKLSAKRYECGATAIYPPQWRSRLLSLRNLWLPFHNKRFAFLVGVIYFLYAWVWAASDPRQSPIMAKLYGDIQVVASAAEKNLAAADAQVKDLKQEQQRLATTPGAPAEAASKLAADLARAEDRQRMAAADLSEVRDRQLKMLGDNDQRLLEKLSVRLTAIFQDPALSVGGKIGGMIGAMVTTSLAYILDPQAFFTAAERNPTFAFLLIGLWLGLVFYVELPSGWLGGLGKLIVGTAHFAAHVLALLVVSWLATGTSTPLAAVLSSAMPGSLWPDIIRVTWNLGVTLLLGGILGGLIMGLYWTLTCALFSMHTGDAFGALGIRHYKSFLRIKLEKDRATIYPIALDHVPGRTGWRSELREGEVRPAHDPRILPVKPLQPHLIEPPIMIDVSKVRA